MPTSTDATILQDVFQGLGFVTEQTTVLMEVMKHQRCVQVKEIYTLYIFNYVTDNGRL